MVTRKKVGLNKTFNDDKEDFNIETYNSKMRDKFNKIMTDEQDKQSASISAIVKQPTAAGGRLTKKLSLAFMQSLAGGQSHGQFGARPRDRVESFDRSETGNISALRGHGANTSMLSGFQYGMTPDPKRRTSKRVLVPSRFNL